MGCSRLRKCCCCASVQTGSLVTGVLGIVLSVATILFIWLYPQRYTLEWDDTDGDGSNWLGISNTAMKIILTVNLVMTILISTFMMVGAVKHKSWFMLPWVVLGVVLSIGALISVLHTSIKLFLYEEPTPAPTTTTAYPYGYTTPPPPDTTSPRPQKHDYTVAAILILVGGLLYICVFVYLWCVVFSHYLNVKDEEERGRYMKTPYRR